MGRSLQQQLKPRGRNVSAGTLGTTSARGYIERVEWSRALRGEDGCGEGAARGKRLFNPREVEWSSPGHVLT